MQESDDVRTVRRVARRIMGDFGPEYFRDCDLERRFPERFFAAVGEAGFFGALIPERYAGSAAGPAAVAALIEEINRAGGDAAPVGAQIAICGAIVRGGSEAQRETLLPAIARGQLRCLALAATEPDSGSDMSRLRSRARRDGEGWRLDAHKVFISMAEHTDVLIVLVVAEEGPTLFVVDRSTCGDHLRLDPLPVIANRMTTTLFIDDLHVEDSARLGEVGGGLRCLLGGFPVRRVLAASESIGNARFLLDRALEHASQREVFGRVVGSRQGVQYPLVQAYAKVEAAELMRADALQLIEDGKDAQVRSALAKVLASEAAWEMARAALTAFGGWGLASELHIERKLRECSVFVFNNLLLNLVAERALGLPAD